MTMNWQGEIFWGEGIEICPTPPLPLSSGLGIRTQGSGEVLPEGKNRERDDERENTEVEKEQDGQREEVRVEVEKKLVEKTTKVKRGRFEESSQNQSISTCMAKKREGKVDSEREGKEVEYNKINKEYTVTQNCQVEKIKNMYEGEVDNRRGNGKVDYDERVNRVERKKTTTTIRERTKIFGETRLEKIEREREKIKVEKREREKVERGKKVT